GASSASCCPAVASTDARCPMVAPACTRTTRSPAACSMTWSIARRSTTRSQADGARPQPSPVPVPRGTTASPADAAARSSAAASCVLAGDPTNDGIRPPTASAGSPSRSDGHAAVKADLTPATTVRSVSIKRSPPARPLRRVAGHLAAQPGRGEDLARVAQVSGVERAADQLHGVQVVGAEHLGHVPGLVHADAVLAGDRAALFQARVEDLA